MRARFGQRRDRLRVSPRAPARRVDVPPTKEGIDARFRRIFARRLVKSLVILALIGLAVSGVIVAATSHRPTAADLARADQQAAGDLQRCYAGHLVPERFVPEGKTLEEYCREIVVPENHITVKALFLRDLPRQLQGVSFILIVGGLVIGASFVGAEWHAER